MVYMFTEDRINGLLKLLSSTAVMSWPIPLPTVLIPLKSIISANKTGLLFVMPPEVKFREFIYIEISGPV